MDQGPCFALSPYFGLFSMHPFICFASDGTCTCIVNLGLIKFQNGYVNYLLILQDLANCLKLRKAQVDKIEATYAYLQEQPSGNKTELFCEIPPDCSYLNQDLVNVTEKIKLRKEKKIDYEMVL